MAPVAGRIALQRARWTPNRRPATSGASRYAAFTPDRGIGRRAEGGGAIGGRLLSQRQMHAVVAKILLATAWLDAFAPECRLTATTGCLPPARPRKAPSAWRVRSEDGRAHRDRNPCRR